MVPSMTFIAIGAVVHDDWGICLYCVSEPTDLPLSLLGKLSSTEQKQWLIYIIYLNKNIGVYRIICGKSLLYKLTIHAVSLFCRPCWPFCVFVTLPLILAVSAAVAYFVIINNDSPLVCVETVRDCDIISKFKCFTVFVQLSMFY